LNPFLASIGFWKRMEDTISWGTGMQPREDDALWTVQSSGNAGEEVSSSSGKDH